MIIGGWDFEVIIVSFVKMGSREITFMTIYFTMTGGWDFELITCNI